MSKNIEELNNNIDQFDLVDLYGTLHLTEKSTFSFFKGKWNIHQNKAYSRL